MPAQPSDPADDQTWVTILEETTDYAYHNLFRLTRAKLQYRRFDGQLSAPITRLSFERGDSVGVLLYDSAADAVVLVRQFRYPVYAGLSPSERAGAGAQRAWLIEIVAGVQDAGLNAMQVARKELLEEAGYTFTGELQPIAVLYPSPGGSSERIHLYLGHVDQRQHAGRDGGLVSEGEDTQLLSLSFQEAMAMIGRGEICDAKTIVALQHLALAKAQQR